MRRIYTSRVYVPGGGGRGACENLAGAAKTFVVPHLKSFGANSSTCASVVCRRETDACMGERTGPQGKGRGRGRATLHSCAGTPPGSWSA